MIQTAINTLITVVIGAVFGYCVNVIKSYKSKLLAKEKNENIQNIALLTMIQSNLTNTYFVYNELKRIPDYVLRNWNNLFEIYQKLGGNDYCHTLKIKMESWEIVKTDIL